MEIALAALLALGALATFVGLAGLAILGPREKRAVNEIRTMDSVRRHALVEMAQAHSRAKH